MRSKFLSGLVFLFLTIFGHTTAMAENEKAKPQTKMIPIGKHVETGARIRIRIVRKRRYRKSRRGRIRVRRTRRYRRYRGRRVRIRRARRYRRYKRVRYRKYRKVRRYRVRRIRYRRRR